MLEKKEFVNNYQAKDEVKSIFFVKYIAVMEARDGKNYLNMILADKSGTMEARKWHGALEVRAKVDQGDFVFITGRINQFQNRLQLIVKEIKKVEEDEARDLDVDLFYQKSAQRPEKMLEELIEFIVPIKDLYIKDLLSAVLYDAEISAKLKSWPAAKTIHHAYKSGLLEHTLGCTKMAALVSPLYNLNYDFMVAGTILHDLGKLYELKEGPLIDYSDEGRLVGHIFKSVEILSHFCSKFSFFPNDTHMHLKHILLAHHGEYEYGSPKLPATKEAMMVHYIDLVDSKLNAFDTIINNDKNIDHWSSHVKHLNRMIYKDDLPTYTNYVDIDHNKNHKLKYKNSSQSGVDSELTFSLADKLKDLKVD